jgi:hypothetical protein
VDSRRTIGFISFLTPPDEGLLFLKNLAEASEPGLVSGLAERARRAEPQFSQEKLMASFSKEEVPMSPLSPLAYPHHSVYLLTLHKYSLIPFKTKGIMGISAVYKWLEFCGEHGGR